MVFFNKIRSSSDFENKISYMTITGGSVAGGAAGKAVGGLVGEVARDAHLTIENSGFEGFVNTSGSLVGGLVGYFSNQGSVTTATNKIINSYSMAKLIGSAKFSGGAVGVIENSNLVSLEKIYYGATNSCTGSNKAGFVSVNNSSSTYMSSNFWDITKNAALNDVSTGSVGDVLKVRSESTTNLNAQSTFETLGGWDFVNTWVISGSINSGYPTLKNTQY